MGLLKPFANNQQIPLTTSHTTSVVLPVKSYEQTKSAFDLDQSNDLDQLKKEFIKRITDKTFIQAFDNEWIEQERNARKNMGCAKRFISGVQGVAEKCVPVLIAVLTSKILYNLYVGSSPLPLLTTFVSSLGEYLFADSVLATSIGEEIIFRGIVQNTVGIVQKTLTSLTPEFLQNTAAFKWCTSSSGKIVSSNLLFALAHSRSTQIANILLLPHESIQFETTGMAASIGAHMANNYFAKVIKNI